MSVSQRSVRPLAANVLVAAAVVFSTGACFHATSGSSQLAALEPPTPRQQSTYEARQRRFPGAEIVPMGQSAFVIKIHSGLVGFGEPLYVIDGAPAMISPSRGIDWFKPEDIAQVKVLKRPDELAIYGPAGVNGVILITTKQAAGRSGSAY